MNWFSIYFINLKVLYGNNSWKKKKKHFAILEIALLLYNYCISDINVYHLQNKKKKQKMVIDNGDTNSLGDALSTDVDSLLVSWTIIFLSFSSALFIFSVSNKSCPTKTTHWDMYVIIFTTKKRKNFFPFIGSNPLFFFSVWPLLLFVVGYCCRVVDVKFCLLVFFFLLPIYF